MGIYEKESVAFLGGNEVGIHSKSIGCCKMLDRIGVCDPGCINNVGAMMIVGRLAGWG